MNLKDWKKIKEDAKTCTLEHPKGHTMTIAISALPKIQREQLKRLAFAKGGRVDEMLTRDDALASGAGGTSTQGHDVRRKDFKEAKKEAKGRAEFERVASKPKIKGLADGGEVSKEDDLEKEFDAEPLKNDVVMEPPPPAQQQQPQVVVNNISPQAPAAPSVPVVPVAPPKQPPLNFQAPVSMNPVNGSGLPSAQPPGQINPKIESVPNTLNDDATANIKEAHRLELLSGRQQQAVDSEMSKASEAVQSERVKAERDLQNAFVNNTKELNSATQSTIQDMKDGYIKADNYRENMSTPAKVRTAIGAFLGGFGTAFGGTNYAYDFLNKQIDRDIDAQKTKFNQQNNVLSAYHNLYKDNIVATNMTKIALNDITVHEMGVQAAKLGTVQAQAKYNAYAAQKTKENHDLLMQSAGRLGTIRTGEKDQPPDHSPNAQYHVLVPGAEEKVKGKAWGKAFPPGTEKSVSDQYNAALQTDRAIDKSDKLYDLMESNATEAGNLSRALKQATATPDILGIGEAANFLNHYTLADTYSNRKYMSAYMEMYKAIRSAVPQAGDHAIAELVLANAPAAGDPEDLKEQKRHAIKQFLHDNQEHGYLSTADLYNKPRPESPKKQKDKSPPKPLKSLRPDSPTAVPNGVQIKEKP